MISASAHAFGVEQPLPVPAQEDRAQALFREIRCVVCQGETINDSPAQVAADVRRLVRARIAMGDGDEAIKAYLVSRYGDQILMRPPVKPSTLPLWLGPLAILGFALFAARSCFRKRT